MIKRSDAKGSARARKQESHHQGIIGNITEEARKASRGREVILKLKSYVLMLQLH
jgi:hypothetical protein